MVCVTSNFTLQLNKEKHDSQNVIFELGIPMWYTESFQSIE